VSAPEDRLVNDATVERFQDEAVTILAGYPNVNPILRNLLLRVLVLARDRNARQELAATLHSRP